MPLDQSQTPLLSRLQQCASQPYAAFHTPGHKRGQGISQQQSAVFGKAVFGVDLPELPDLDNLFAPEGVILQAQELAAAAFGAEQTWFLANGSTCGIEAAILATCGPGEKLILPRNVHTSAISGMVLSGAVPVYVQPDYSTEWDMPVGVSAAAIEAALKEHPDARAVMIVSPTYHGICSDVAAIARIAHHHGCPLIVDEAHAPHFAFHPHFPPSALAAKADLAIQSAHKVLSAFTQAALMHIQGNRIDRNRLAKALQLTQSTSPSYLLLGSLDAARQQMATSGIERMTQAIALADRAVEALSKLAGLQILQPKWGEEEKGEREGKTKNQTTGGGELWGDRTRITVDVTKLGLTGFEADEILYKQLGVAAELPALRHLMFIVTLGNTEADITRLIQAFHQLCHLHHPSEASANTSTSKTSTSKTSNPLPKPYAPLPILHSPLPTPHPPTPPITPRQAFFSPTRPIPLAQSPGHICAETICPYPPGIPLLLPGEPVTAGAIAQLRAIQAAGGLISGCRDPSLETIQVMESNHGVRS